MVEGVVDTVVSAGERYLYAVFDDSMSREEKRAYALDPRQMVADFVTGVVIGEFLDGITAAIQNKLRSIFANYDATMREALESGSSSVNDIVDIMKSGNMTADGRNIITQLDENTKVIFRMDVGENAHSMEMYGYSNPVNHINIEIQVKASSGKYKPKWNFHMILDNLGEVSDSFATGIWTKK